jgi:hypothetical protein
MSGALSFVGVLLLDSAFAISHFGRRFTSRIKRRWQAVSAGVTLAYVFVNVIPELEEHRPTVAASAAQSVLDAEKRIYLWTLTGFVVFVGLSRLPEYFRSETAKPAARPFWGEMAGYALYTLLIGYLLTHREDPSLLSLALFEVAMFLHLFMVDVELMERFRVLYVPWGRVLLMAAVMAGWILGMADAFPDTFTSRLFAFVIGGVVLLSAHEQLPAETERPFWWFAGGAFAYAALLMLI